MSKKISRKLGFDDPGMARRYWVAQALKEEYPLSRNTRKKIIEIKPVDELVNLLSGKNEYERNIGTELLWLVWIHEAGMVVAKKIEKGIQFMENQEYEKAVDLFTKIINKHPKFAEGYNKRATVFYLMGCYENSIRDCKIVINLNPVHFGAWHGLGLCQMQMGRYRQAIKTFQRALDIQPYAKSNHQYIEYCKLRIADKGE